MRGHWLETVAAIVIAVAMIRVIVFSGELKFIIPATIALFLVVGVYVGPVNRLFTRVIDKVADIVRKLEIKEKS